MTTKSLGESSAVVSKESSSLVGEPSCRSKSLTKMRNSDFVPTLSYRDVEGDGSCSRVTASDKGGSGGFEDTG